jgi:general secretion pathway protein N
VDWALRPSLRGLNMRWNASCCMAAPMPIRIQPHWGGAKVQLGAHESRWPASLLVGLGTPWNTIQPQGQLLLKTRELSLALNAGRLQVEGGADLDVMAVTSRLSTIQPLGSYRLQLQGGDSTSLQLTTLDGALQLKGQGQWVGQRLRFQGEAWAAEGREAALANLLTMIGQRSGSRVLLSVG